MSQIGRAIYAMLTTDATISALVSNRIYPTNVPARVTMPYVVYSKTSAVPTNDKDGPSVVDEEFYQVDVYSTTYDQAHAISDRIRSVIDGVSNTISGVAISQISFEGENDNAYQDDLGLFWVSLDFKFRVLRAGTVRPTAQYFSQIFEWADVQDENTVSITENGGVLPVSDAAISVLVDYGGGAFVFTTEWSRNGSDIVFESNLPIGSKVLVSWTIQLDGSNAYRQIFTGINAYTFVVTENTGILPENNAAVWVHLNGIYTTEWTRTGAVFTTPYLIQPDWQIVVTFFI